MDCMPAVHCVTTQPHDALQRAVKKITGTPLEDAQVDIIFSIFDVENDGSLACSEFVGVIKCVPCDSLCARLCIAVRPKSIRRCSTATLSVSRPHCVLLNAIMYHAGYGPETASPVHAGITHYFMPLTVCDFGPIVGSGRAATLRPAQRSSKRCGTWASWLASGTASDCEHEPELSRRNSRQCEFGGGSPPAS